MLRVPQPKCTGEPEMPYPMSQVISAGIDVQAYVVVRVVVVPPRISIKACSINRAQDTGVPSASSILLHGSNGAGYSRIIRCCERPGVKQRPQIIARIGSGDVHFH